MSIQFDVVGDGEPLLLLAGQANSRHWWDPVRDDLAARHRMVALDALGTGASTPPDGAEYSTRRFAEDAVAVLDAAGIGRAHVYGTSMGGKVAQWLAIDHPDRVGALVLGCTTPGGPRALLAGRDVVGPLAGPTAAARRALAELMVTPAWLDRHPGGADAVLGDQTMTQAARRGHRIASAPTTLRPRSAGSARRPWCCTAPTTRSAPPVTPTCSSRASRGRRCSCSRARGTRTSWSTGPPRRPRCSPISPPTPHKLQ